MPRTANPLGFGIRGRTPLLDRCGAETGWRTERHTRENVIRLLQFLLSKHQTFKDIRLHKVLGYRNCLSYLKVNNSKNYQAKIILPTSFDHGSAASWAPGVVGGGKPHASVLCLSPLPRTLNSPKPIFYHLRIEFYTLFLIIENIWIVWIPPSGAHVLHTFTLVKVVPYLLSDPPFVFQVGRTTVGEIA